MLPGRPVQVMTEIGAHFRDEKKWIGLDGV